MDVREGKAKDGRERKVEKEEEEECRRRRRGGDGEGGGKSFGNHNASHT